MLDLRSNALTGEIPPELGNLAALQVLDLRSNALTGEIPPELGNLTALQELDLGYIDLTGPIPPELGDLTALKKLDLGGRHRLTGRIPPELGNLTALETLDLSGRIYGPDGTGNDIPRPLGLMSGALPASLTNLRELRELWVWYTKLCGLTDPGFRQWLDQVERHNVPLCPPYAPVKDAYLVQVIQDRESPVPLVAGRDALLRVFLTAPWEGPQVPVPFVRARFYVGAEEVFSADMVPGVLPGKVGIGPLPPAYLPSEIDEFESDYSAVPFAHVPGDVVRPGLEMVIEIDPEGTLDPALGIGGRVPAEGRTALDVHVLPPLELTIVPFVRLPFDALDSSRVATVEAMASDWGHEHLRLPRAILPASDPWDGWSVTAHEPVLYSSSSDPAASIYVARALGGGSGYWMAAGLSGTGWADVSGWVSSIAGFHGSHIAHELGHNMSLPHTPACSAPGPYWGHVNTRSWGFDPTFSSLEDSNHADHSRFHPITAPTGLGVPPRTLDMMGYCLPPDWIGSPQYGRAFAHRLRAETSSAAAFRAAPTRTLLLWGGVDSTGTAAHLEPAFLVDAVPSMPETGGEWLLEGRTEDGGEVFRLSFDMPEIADAPGEWSAFAFTVPVTWTGHLEAIVLTGPGGASAVLDRTTNDPMTILRDPVSGQVRAFLRQPVAEATTAADRASGERGDNLVAFSRGLPR